MINLFSIAVRPACIQKYSCNQISGGVKSINVQVDNASATEMVDSGSIPGRVNQRLYKLVFTASLLDVQQLKRQVKHPPCVVDRWASGSLTQRPKGPSLTPCQGNLVNKM